MTNCVHTGCEVAIPQYGLTVRADLFYIPDAWIVRWLPPGQYAPPSGNQDYSTLEVNTFTYMRADLGILVLPTHYLLVHSDEARKKIKCFRTINGENLNVPRFGGATPS
jgi:hypothetical protein